MEGKDRACDYFSCWVGFLKLLNENVSIVELEWMVLSSFC